MVADMAVSGIRRCVVIALSLLLVGSIPANAAPPSVAPLGPGFMWGVSSSGFQSEGFAPDSNWRRYVDSGKTDDRYGNSVDFLHRYVDDIALAKDLGTTVYRTGVEWARVQPQPGVWDENGFAFYDNVIRAIRAAGMRPMITLDHWVYPGWAADRGGWRDPRMLEDWLANARRVVDRYAQYDPMWVTINEPSAYVLQELRFGGIGPLDAPTMLDRLVQASNTIYGHIHAVQPNAMVTSNVAYVPGGAEAALDQQFLDRAKFDFVGIDYYYGLSPSSQLPASANFWDFPIEADGLYYTLRHYARKFPGRPLYIVEAGMPTENGLPRRDGYTRAAHLRDHVYWLQRAAADGMNVIGYNYWSLTDNYEWGSYAPRFGLYTVDVKTDPSLTRRPTDAVAAYQEIIRDGGVPSGFVPSRPAVTCSLVDAPSSCTEPVR
ncbi:glycoside hydrolase family 1 protein [Nocardiaceae bacterium YC2-7]|uniref:Glycoside hydrolase family 1 protein n=2 Tax=Antrihabitans stalactiti TaxID=2584121 RepID=A0A848K5Z3_9NOCA|nr:glycoside hydrolase family 1 protein [Antrihabitans stalactiti]